MGPRIKPVYVKLHFRTYIVGTCFRPTNPQNTKEVKDIVFLTLTLGWKNEKRPSGPSELDLEAGNLVIFIYRLLRGQVKSKMVG